MATIATNVTGKDIDDILDEIEENEEKTPKGMVMNPKHPKKSGADWKEILSQLQNGNSNFVKALVTSKDIDIDEQDPANGKTVLIYVTIIGNYDLVKLVCNFGANVNIKDHSNCDALDYAQRYGRYAITELLFYRQLSGSLGNDLKEIATNIYDKNEEARRLKANDKEGYDHGEHSIRISNNIIKAMIKAIENRDPFSPDLLYYAWYFYLEACQKNEQGPLTTEFPEEEEEVDNGFYSSREDEYAAEKRRREKNDAYLLTLWKVMMTAYEEILRDTTDKEGWQWLKGYFINSLIWFLPHPVNKTNANDDNEPKDNDDMEYILSTTLFYELLTRVRKESKAQSDLLLKDKIDKIKSETPQEWEALSSYDVSTEFSNNARQDVCGCITPKYTKDQLSEELYPPSTHFSAQKHYDTNIYLNELLFRANIMDTRFQFDMKKITKEINSVTGFDSIYRAGPVKTLTRSQTKVENDYIAEAYPTSAKILDINRCAIQFKTIKEMMKYVELFTERINKKQAYSIVAIIRCKNGWSVYNPQQPQYTDTKLNVLVQSPKEEEWTVVAEIQLLLRLMSAFKKKAHKLYSVERKFELVYNFQKLQNKMSHFKDLFGAENIMIDIFKRNELESFKSYWLVITNEQNPSNSLDALVPSSMEEKNNPWTVPLIYLLMKDDAKDIYQYLHKHYSRILCKALETYLKMCYFERGFGAFLEDLHNKYERQKEVTQDELLYQFIQKVYDFGSVDKELQSETLSTLLNLPDKSTKTFLGAITSKKCPKSFKYIVYDTRIKSEDKVKLFGAGTKGLFYALKNKYLDHISTILFYFNSRKDKQGLLNVLNWKPKKESARIAFLFVCNSKEDKRSLLPFIINNPMIDKEEKDTMVSVKDDTLFTAIELSLEASVFNTQLLLNYFYNKDVNVINMISVDCATEMKLHSDAILALLKHIANDRDKLVQLLGTLGFFAWIMKKNRVRVLKYILYETCLTSSEIIGFIDKKCHFDYSPDHKSCATELIRYFKDDLKSLTHILDTVHDNRSLFKMLYCKHASNETRQILFSDSALSREKMCEYLKRNEKGKGVGDHDHDFGPKKETTFFKLVQGYHGGKNTIALVKYLAPSTFVDMLLQKHSENNEPYLKSKEMDRKDVLESIFTQLKDLRLISRLIENINSAVPAQRELAEQFTEYLTFCDKYNESKDASDEKVDETMFKDIDMKNHPLGTAFLCGNIQIIELFLKRHKWDKDGKTLFHLLNEPKLIKKLFCNGNDNEVTIKILRMLILDNEHLSEAQKFDLISARNKPFDDLNKNFNIIVTPALVETNNTIRLEVLNYFEAQGQKEYILKSLQEEIPWIDQRGRTTLKIVPPMYPICRATFGKNDVPPIEFIINCPLLSEDIKVKLFEDIFINIVKLNKGLSLNVLQFIGHDEKILMNFLSKKDPETKESVLMLMMKMEASKDSESLLYILNNKALSYEYKRKLVFEDIYTFDKNEHSSSNYWGYGPYQHVFALSCKQYHDTRFIEKICDYFDLEKDGNFEKTGDILVKIETANHLKVLLNNITDNNLLRRLFLTKSEDENKFGATAFEACQFHGPKANFHEDIEDKKILNQHKFDMLHKYQDYLALDESLDDEKGFEINISFNEYAQHWSNPWLTCCEFGKMETIMKLIKYVMQRDDNKYTKLKALFTDNYDLLTGNDSMMTLNDNGYKGMIIEILQKVQAMTKDNFVNILAAVLMTKNRVTDKTLLMMIGADDNNYTLVDSLLNMLKDKQRIGDVLNCTDDSGNTCVYFAKGKIKNLMLKYQK